MIVPVWIENSLPAIIHLIHRIYEAIYAGFHDLVTAMNFSFTLLMAGTRCGNGGEGSGWGLD